VVAVLVSVVVLLLVESDPAVVLLSLLQAVNPMHTAAVIRLNTTFFMVKSFIQ
jgi:hypothetical protein